MNQRSLNKKRSMYDCIKKGMTSVGVCPKPTLARSLGHPLWAAFAVAVGCSLLALTCLMAMDGRAGGRTGLRMNGRTGGRAGGLAGVRAGRLAGGRTGRTKYGSRKAWRGSLSGQSICPWRCFIVTLDKMTDRRVYSHRQIDTVPCVRGTDTERYDQKDEHR